MTVIPLGIPRMRVIYLAPDCTDSAVQKRAAGLLAAGQDLICFTFRRTRYNVDYEPPWPNVPLGQTEERRLASRMLVYVKALWRVFSHRRSWRQAQVLYVRNLDLALVGIVGRFLTRCPAGIVYEVLDVHPALTGVARRTQILRWLERQVLRRCELLVVSSPAFLREYFVPLQGYHGRSFLLENKWPYECVAGLPRHVSWPPTSDPPRWTIGWFGNIRCRASLNILKQLACSLPNRLQIRIRGCVSLLGDDLLQKTLREHSNITYEGEYAAPEDLGRVYAGIHFNWCIDLSGADNSRWLLPNRIYEGGYFGVPALALADQETGRIVRERSWGVAFDPPYVGAMREYLENLSVEEYRVLRNRTENLSIDEFVDRGDVVRLMDEIASSRRIGVSVEGQAELMR